MYDKKELLDKVMRDWSFRVDGTPDIQNYEHRTILRKILKEHGIPIEAINMIVQNVAYEKQLLVETDFPPINTITSSGFYGRDKSHSTGSEPQKIIDPYQTQNVQPIQDPNKDDEEEENQDEFTDNPKFESYIFDKAQMKIIKTENLISLGDIIIENKFKCFMTGEVFCETKDGTLVKENDLGIKLNQDQINILSKLPEQGMGFQIVDLKLKNGETLKEKIILNTTYLKLNGSESLKTDDIETIELHK